MKKLVSESIEQATLYPPGKPLDEIKRTYGIDDLVKLNANENCIGPSPLAVKAIRDAAADIHRYPDNSAYYLKHKLAEKYGVTPGQVMLGNGSNELVQFILMTFLSPGQEVLTASPTFVLYGIMGQVMGGRVREVPLKDNCYDLDAMAAAISDETKLVFICNPNNPTGTIVKAEAFRSFMQQVPDDVIVVMDEAYAEFVASPDWPDACSYVKQDRNIIVLRTFSKAYGLAGLRLGYALAPERLTSYLERVREPFNANAVAQQAALAALDDEEHLQKVKDNNREGMQYLCSSFDRLGISYVPSEANFILVFVGPRAEDMAEDLLKQGIMVRPMKGFDLSGCFRLTVGLPDENRRCIEALEKLLPAYR